MNEFLEKCLSQMLSSLDDRRWRTELLHFLSCWETWRHSQDRNNLVLRAFIKNSSSMPSLNVSYLSCTTVFLFLTKFLVWRWSPKMTCTQLFSTAFGKDMPFFSDCHDSIGVAKKPIRWRVPQDRLSQLVLRILFWSRVRWWLRLFSAMMALDTKWGDV